MNHYVYLLQSRTEDKYYIGVRSCKCPISEDSYMGSSRYVDTTNCNKIILKRFNTRHEAVEYEIELHEKFDVAKNPLFWNRAKQTATGFDRAGTKCPEHQKIAISEKLTGRKSPTKGMTFKYKERPYAKGSGNSQARKVKNLTTGMVFGSVLEAAKHHNLGGNGSAISAVCRGKRNKAGNCEWSYI